LPGGECHPGSPASGSLSASRPGRLSQRESAPFTPERSLVRSQYRPLPNVQVRGQFLGACGFPCPLCARFPTRFRLSGDVRPRHSRLYLVVRDAAAVEADRSVFFTSDRVAVTATARVGLASSTLRASSRCRPHDRQAPGRRRPGCLPTRPVAARHRRPGRRGGRRHRGPLDRPRLGRARRRRAGSCGAKAKMPKRPITTRPTAASTTRPA